MAKQPIQVGVGLVRRYIQLRSGNRAWRMVRPDNANIILPQPVDPNEQRRPAAAAVDVASVVVQEEPKTVETVIDSKRLFRNDGYQSCCGASFLVGQPADAKSLSPEEEARLYYERSGFAQNVEQYKGYVKIYEDDLAAWEAAGGKARLTPHRGLTPVTCREYIADYKRVVDKYDFDYMFKKGQLNGRDGNYNRDMRRHKSPGIALSAEPFHGSHQTPAGLWVRNDYPIKVEYSGKPFDVPAPFETPDANRDKSRNAGFYLREYPQAAGHTVWTISGMSHDDLANDIASFVAKTDRLKVGDIITFILNKGQGTQQKLNKLAAAGYRHVLTTSNSQHQGSSILYLFERTLTEVDKPNNE